MGLRPTIDQVRNLGMHASHYRWGVQLVKIPASLGGFGSSDLNLRALSIEPPTRTIEDTEINFRGTKIYQHGIITYNPIQLTLHELVDSRTITMLENWMDSQWNPDTGAQVPKIENQAEILLSLLDSQDLVRCTYHLYGAWPTHFDHGGVYDSVTSDTVKPIVTLRYDKYTYTLNTLIL